MQIVPERAEMKELVTLALPIVTVQVGMMFMGVVDTIMVGHISAVALAAVALGNLFYFTFAILLNSVGTVILQVINNYGVSKSSASVLEGRRRREGAVP